MNAGSEPACSLGPCHCGSIFNISLYTLKSTWRGSATARGTAEPKATFACVMSDVRPRALEGTGAVLVAHVSRTQEGGEDAVFYVFYFLYKRRLRGYPRAPPRTRSVSCVHLRRPYIYGSRRGELWHRSHYHLWYVLNTSTVGPGARGKGQSRRRPTTRPGTHP